MIRFIANGKEFELPDSGTFTLDEGIVMYGYSGLTMDAISEIEGLHPGVIAGLVHVGIARANPEIKAKEIEAEVRRLNIADLITSIEDTDQEQEPEQLDLGSAGNSGSSETPSGNDSVTSSEPQEPTTLRAIGTPVSESAPSVQETSAG